MSADPIGSQLFLQIFLIALNAFFASTEIALLSLNEKKLRKAAEDGDAKAAKLLKIVELPTNFLSTIQVGITLAGFLGSAFAADSFSGRLAEWLISHGVTFIPSDAVEKISLVLITLLLSYFTLVFGELVPKRVAMKNPEKVANFTSGVIRALSFVLRPIIAFLSLSTNLVLRLFGINPHENEENVTEEDIRLMVDVGEENGAIETGEKEMIENIFEFNNFTAADLMVHRTSVTAFQADESSDEIVKIIEESGLSRFPVYEDDIDSIIGILSTRKFLLNLRSDHPKPIRELIYPAHLVPETVRADVLLRDMQQNKIHMAVVVDEYGGTSGIVTMEDLLEEIVGNIYDEFDPLEEKDVIKLGDNLWKVAGSTDLDLLAEELDFTFDENDDEYSEYDTLGGLVFSQLTVIPEDGSKPEVDVCGLHIKVLALADRRVEWAEVSINPKEEKEEGSEKSAKKSDKKDND